HRIFWLGGDEAIHPFAESSLYQTQQIRAKVRGSALGLDHRKSDSLGSLIIAKAHIWLVVRFALTRAVKDLIIGMSLLIILCRILIATPLLGEFRTSTNFGAGDLGALHRSSDCVRLEL